jgi:hypothetical protein
MERERALVKEKSRYMGKAVFGFTCCYDSITIKDEKGNSSYRMVTSFYACMFWRYVYINITCLKKGHKDDRGFGFRAEKLDQELRENNLIDAIYIYFPKGAKWNERAVMIAAAVMLENSTFVSSTQNNG